MPILQDHSHTNQQELRAQISTVELPMHGKSILENSILNIQNLVLFVPIIIDVSISNQHNDFNLDVFPPQTPSQQYILQS